MGFGCLIRARNWRHGRFLAWALHVFGVAHQNTGPDGVYTESNRLHFALLTNYAASVDDDKQALIENAQLNDRFSKGQWVYIGGSSRYRLIGVTFRDFLLPNPKLYC